MDTARTKNLSPSGITNLIRIFQFEVGITDVGWTGWSIMSASDILWINFLWVLKQQTKEETREFRIERIRKVELIFCQAIDALTQLGKEISIWLFTHLHNDVYEIW